MKKLSSKGSDLLGNQHLSLPSVDTSVHLRPAESADPKFFGIGSSHSMIGTVAGVEVNAAPVLHLEGYSPP
jgi:hypothetical protein